MPGKSSLHGFAMIEARSSIRSFALVSRAHHKGADEKFYEDVGPSVKHLYPWPLG